MLNNLKTRASLARMSNRARHVAVAVLAGVLLCAGAQARGDAVVTDLVVVGSDAQTLIFHRAFQRTAFSYSTAVPFAVSSVRVTATAEGAGASMRIGAVTLTSGAISAAINLDVGANALALIVTAGDASATYTLNIAREAGPPAPSSNADLADLRLTFGAFNEAFAPATQTYTATVPHLTAHLIAVLADPDAAFVNVHAEIGTLKSGERSTEPLAAPNPGDKRVIGFTVRAVDGTEKVYVITLMDEENTSATVNRIDILSCTTAAVGCAGRNFLGTNPVYAPPFSPDDPDMLDYTVTLPHDTPTNIAFDVRLTDGSTEGTLALVTTTGTAAVADNEITDDAESLPIPLGDATPPDNTVNLIITAKAGNTLTYALTMLFAPGPKTALTITPVAAAKTKTYGQPDPALAYDVTGLTDDTADEVFSATPFARATGEDAGEYAFSLKNPLPFRASFAAKYSVSLAASQVFLIAKKPLVHTDAAADKTYDGNNHPPASFAVPLTAAVRATIGSVMIDDSTPHRLRVRGCAFADKHAGDDKPITGCALAGGARDNYALSVTAAGDIGKLATRLTGIATAREYDGSADIGLPLASATFVPPIVRGDMVRVSGGAFADANPETGKTAAAAGITYAGADIGNYLITPVISGDITPKTVMVAEVVLQKEYDGARTLGASVIQDGSGEITGEVGDDAVTIAVGAAPGDIYAAAAAGAQTVTGVMFTLEASGGANAQNYQLPSVVAVSGLITKKAVTVTATDARRQYDGTTGAPSAARGAFASGNILSDDAPDVSIVFGTYNHKDAGQATTLSLELSGDKAGNYMPNPTVTASIIPRHVTVGTVTVRKEYDGNTTTAAGVVLDGGEIGNEAPGEELALGHVANSGAYASAGAGSPSILLIRFELVEAGGSGAMPANYGLPAVTAFGSITPKAVTVTATDANKQYDGNTGAPPGVGGTFAAGNILAADEPDVSIVFGTYNHKDAGQATTLSLELSGDKAGNYMSNPTVAAGITRRHVTVGAAVLRKEYDGDNTTAGAVLGGGEIGNEAPGEELALRHIANSGGYAGVSAGSREILFVQFELVEAGGSGAMPANYELPGILVTGLITPKPVMVTATDASKEYDGNTGAPSGVAGAFASGNILAADAPDVTAGFGTYNNKNAADAVTLSVELSGDKSGNYMPNPTVPAGITRKTFAIADATLRKVYDATTAGDGALPDGGEITGEVGSEILTLQYADGTATYASVNAASGIGISGAEFSVQAGAGTERDNYAEMLPAFALDGEITAKPISLTGLAGNSKRYDGGNDAPPGIAATFTAGARIAVDVGDAKLALVFGTYNSKNVAEADMLGISLRGESKDNYELDVSGVAATISKRRLNITAANLVVAAIDARPAEAELRISIGGDGYAPGEDKADALRGALAYGTADADDNLPIEQGSLLPTANYAIAEFIAGLLTVGLVFDADDNNTADDVDGLLIARYLLGLRGDALMMGLEDRLPEGTTAAKIQEKIAAAGGKLDVDGPGGEANAADGIMIARYFLGVTSGAALTDGQSEVAPDVVAKNIADTLPEAAPAE